ncbi:hypothetical protein HZ878_004791 [Escherichia coli]|nr:hypothetical protein [Escherichia coli]EFQ7648160.1 hypothetical protein [Escherichia coli]
MKWELKLTEREREDLLDVLDDIEGRIGILSLSIRNNEGSGIGGELDYIAANLRLLGSFLTDREELRE